jgi:hypothetical protein
MAFHFLSPVVTISILPVISACGIACISHDLLLAYALRRA